MKDLEPAFAADGAPRRNSSVVKARIVLCAILCVIVSSISACSLLAPWHGTPDRGGLGDLGCIAIHGGCPSSSSPPTYTDHSGVHDVGVWPMIILFGLASIAMLAALWPTRAMQLLTGMFAILVPLLVGPYVLVATGLAHLFDRAESRGGAVALYLMLFMTFATGIINIIEPRLRSRSPTIELPRARARVHVSGMHVPQRDSVESDDAGGHSG